MSNPDSYKGIPTAELQQTISTAEKSLRDVTEFVLGDTQIRETVTALMRADDLAGELSALCQQRPEEAQHIMTSAMAALANVCTIHATGDELRRRAEGN